MFAIMRILRNLGCVLNQLVCGGRENVARYFSAEAACSALGKLVADAAAGRNDEAFGPRVAAV